MKNIDKILIRLAILALLGLLTKNARETKNACDLLTQIRNNQKSSINAGLVPLPERKK